MTVTSYRVVIAITSKCHFIRRSTYNCGKFKSAQEPLKFKFER